MVDDGLKYDVMVERALRGVLRDALNYVAENGLPGDHHFYITFRTDHPDVGLPDHLHERYPSEMTIVLQHQFWALEVAEESFGVTLSFSDVPEHLMVPFEAVVAFADPSVRFVLQFDGGAGGEEAEARPSAEVETLPVGEAAVQTAEKPTAKPAVKMVGPKAGANAAKGGKAKTSGAAARGGEEGDDGTAEKIITLDSFRKK